MSSNRKLRPDTSVTGIGQPVVVIFLFAIVWMLLGKTSALVLISVIYCLYGLLSLGFFIRTRNPWFIATLIFQATVMVYALIAPKVGLWAIDKESFKPLTLLLVVELAVLAYIFATGKLKWKGREVLELAAMEISEVTNGYTDRPRPAGKLEISETELIGFVDYLKENLIAVSFRENRQTIIVPVKMGEEYSLQLRLSKKYHDHTRIIVGADGIVSAQISKKDYLNFKEALSFDQLSQSLGDLFIKFSEYYKEGEEIRIITELKKVNTGPFS